MVSSMLGPASRFSKSRSLPGIFSAVGHFADWKEHRTEGQAKIDVFVYDEWCAAIPTNVSRK
jgi:hypothetical protein